MSNLFVNTRDQKFLLKEQLDVKGLLDSEQFAGFSIDVIDMIMSEAEKLAVNVIAPINAVGDKEGCSFRDGKVMVPNVYQEAYQKFLEGGWLALTEAQEDGGQGVPLSVGNACKETFCAASSAFMTYPALTRGAAALIAHNGTEKQKEKYMYKMFSGKWGGTMCLTEPNAGTDVGALRTTAKRLEDGTYSISGTKCFISCGDHDLTENIIHPVLARIEGDPPGTKGISLFIVPKYRVKDDGTLGEWNDVSTGNIEHKMGIKGSATCTLNFGDSGDCIGEILGNEREGMKIMFQMMNEARLGTGVQGIGYASTAYEHAVEYAKQRIQSPPVWEAKNPNAKPVSIIKHPYVRRTLLWMKSYVEGLRALNYYAALAFDLARIADSDEEKEKWNGILELLTPICKSFTSDKAFEICSKAIDIHGGYGYCSEYPVEQYLRDCKVASIYEGTNGIHALDLVGRKLGQRKGGNVTYLIEEMNHTRATLEGSVNLRPLGPILGEAVDALQNAIMKFGEFMKDGVFMVPILNASPFLDVMGDVVLGWLLLQGSVVAEDKAGVLCKAKGNDDTPEARKSLAQENKEMAFYCGRIASARFFATTVLPTVKSRCLILEQREAIPLNMAEEEFTS